MITVDLVAAVAAWLPQMGGPGNRENPHKINVFWQKLPQLPQLPQFP